jgi:GT2 family glycosyltransferase
MKGIPSLCSNKFKADDIFAVIVNWNQPMDTLECLASLKNQTIGEINIVLVDNGSTDKSVEIISKRHPEIKILPLPDNLGFAGGYNFGIQYALDNNANFIFIINNDAFVDPNAISILLPNAQDSSIGIVAPIIFYADSPKQIWSSGGKLKPILLEHTKKEKQKKTIRSSTPQVIKRDFVTGCCFLAHRKTFETIGLFDERFQMYYEDSDFCIRLKKADLKILVVQDAKAWHKVSLSSGGKDSPNERFWMGKSSIQYFRKHASGSQWLLIIPWRFLSALRTTIRLINNRKFKSLIAFWRGTLEGLIS